MYSLKNQSRALRRHHIQRLKRVRKHYWGFGRHYGTEGHSKMDARQLGKVVQNPHPCSCAMCCNVRRIHGDLTRAEIRYSINYREQLDEAINDYDHALRQSEGDAKCTDRGD